MFSGKELQEKEKESKFEEKDIMCFKKQKDKIVSERERIPLQIEFDLNRCAKYLSEYFVYFPEKEDRSLIKKIEELAEQIQGLVNNNDGPGIHFHGV